MTLIELYGPFLVALVVLFVAARLKKGHRGVVPIKLPVVGVEIPVRKRVAYRAGLLFVAASCIYYYLVIDFAKFFPSEFKMEVFYDEPGIRKRLAQFSPEELIELSYTESNFGQRAIYYRDLDTKLRTILKYPEFFSLHEGIVHSNGSTSFHVEKTAGFYNYRIGEAKGELLHVLERPNAQAISFRTFFERIPSADDYIRPRWSEILLKHSVILRPRFKQILAEQYRSDGVVFDHTLIGVTKVELFPLPRFDSTLYFIEVPGKGLVPVGYAEYAF